MLNTITIAGRLTKDPEIKKTEGKGTSYAVFSIANERGFGDTKKTGFFDVTVWGNAAERMEKAKVQKGSYIYLRGSLSQQVYEKDGTKRSKVNVIVGDSGEWEFIYTGPKAENTSASGNGNNATAAPSSPPAPTMAGTTDEQGFMVVPNDDELPF